MYDDLLKQLVVPNIADALAHLARFRYRTCTMTRYELFTTARIATLTC